VPVTIPQIGRYLRVTAAFERLKLISQEVVQNVTRDYCDLCTHRLTWDEEITSRINGSCRCELKCEFEIPRIIPDNEGHHDLIEYCSRTSEIQCTPVQKMREATCVSFNHSVAFYIVYHCYNTVINFTNVLNKVPFKLIVQMR